MPKILQPAGFWRRVAAHLLDAVFIGLINALPFTLLISMSNWSYPEFQENFHIEWAIFGAILSLVYYVYFTASKFQATPGKRIMNVYVVGADSQRISWKRSLCRYLACFIIIIAAADYKKLQPYVEAYKIPDSEVTQCLENKLANKTTETPGLLIEMYKKTCKLDIIGKRMDEIKKEAAANGNPNGEIEHLTGPQKKKLYSLAKTSQEISQDFGIMTTTQKIQYYLNIIAGLYILALAFRIGWFDDKKGFHDKLCKTRAVQGRP